MYFCGDRSSDCANDKPLSRRANSLTRGTAVSELPRGVPFPAEGLGLGFFVGEVGCGGSQPRLAYKNAMDFVVANAAMQPAEKHDELLGRRERERPRVVTSTMT